MKKRILPALLALCMVISLLPVSVFAASPVASTMEGCIEGCTETAGATENDPTTYSHAPNCLNGCTGTAECTRDVYTGKHKADCVKFLKGPCKTDNAEGNAAFTDCTNDAETGHFPGCPKLTAPYNGCTCSDVNCPNKANHNSNQNDHVGSCTGTPVSGDDKCAACGGVEQCTGVTDTCTIAAKGTHKTNCTNGCTMTADCTANGGKHKAKCPGACDMGEGDTTNHVCAQTDTASTSHKVGCKMACTGEADCPNKDITDASAHKDTGCNSQKVPYEAKGTITLSCDCMLHDNNNDHGAGAIRCTTTWTKEVTVTLYFDTAVTDEASLTDPQKTAISNAISSKESDENNDSNGKVYCAACEAAKIKECKGTVNCTADVHNDNCLKLCKDKFNTADCPNDAGVADAHAIKYVVFADGAEAAPGDGESVVFWNDRQAATQRATTLSNKQWTAYNTALKAYNDAVAAGEATTSELNTLKAAYEAAYTATVNSWVTYSVKVYHCGKAGEVDSTVIVAEGSTVEPATDDTKTPEETKAPEKAEDFEDVPENAWYAGELTSLMKKGVIVGSIDGGKYSFKPGDKMSTSMVVVMLSRVLDKGFNTTGADWDKEALAWAAEDGLTEGIEAGEITRKDVVLVMWRAAGSPKSEQSLEKFTDAGDLEGDALAAMKWAVEQGIIKGDDQNQLNAKSVIIRSEMVAVIARFDGVVNAD